MEKRERLRFMLGLTIVTIFLISQTANATAINDQDLIWGIELNNRFDYGVELEYRSSAMNVSIDDKMYVIVNKLNTIPDHVANDGLSQVQIFSLSLAVVVKSFLFG